MRLSRSLARKLVRSGGVCLAVLAGWTLLDRIVLTPAAGQATPTGDGTPPPPTRRRPVMTPYAQSKLAAMRAPLDRITPVTDEMLRNPPPGDWLQWRRTYDGWAYSPLMQINRDTVKNLKVARTWSLASPEDAVNEFTPLVH